jgi:hypothetical protein
MATFTNQATLTYNDTTTSSNIVTGEILEVLSATKTAVVDRYDPNGTVVERGDTVLVPTFDKHRHGEIHRTATVINGNYRTNSLPADKVLKKIVRVVK